MNNSNNKNSIYNKKNNCKNYNNNKIHHNNSFNSTNDNTYSNNNSSSDNDEKNIATEIMPIMKIKVMLILIPKMIITVTMPMVLPQEKEENNIYTR